MKAVLRIQTLAAIVVIALLAPARADDALVLTDTPAVEDEELDTERGQSDQRWADLRRASLSEVSVDADVAGNTVTSSPSGDNVISDTALQGARGFFTLIQNSGNDVVIQEITVVNITVE